MGAEDASRACRWTTVLQQELKSNQKSSPSSGCGRSVWACVGLYSLQISHYQAGPQHCDHVVHALILPLALDRATTADLHRTGTGSPEHGSSPKKWKHLGEGNKLERTVLMGMSLAISNLLPFFAPASCVCEVHRANSNEYDH